MEIFDGDKQGQSITQSQSILLETYKSVGWGDSRWSTNNNSSYPIVKINSWDILTTDFTLQGSSKAHEQLKQKSTYESIDWDFTTPIWYINEGLSYPTLQEQKIKLPITAIGYTKINGEVKAIYDCYAKINGVVKRIKLM